ncbi:hypothetical protein GCM10010218_28910 [Streptomyces mashuensis]|uniref:DUF2993 domain-containing protein n=1 Tax=Streptomyces mashuensis TaxID=33904 RepID=A0A919B2Z1_9ACTN|nr:DUF2993 domain-containing protein [Streptomyces mashuensis]GHF45910.1 hypothetical protein GCM10010218_28910 [Streptomyces mashuensis]
MRLIRNLVITAVVLGGILVGADRAAVWFAEDQAAEKIRSSQGLAATPEVSIKGFPFLTQVASSQLDEVEIKLDQGVTASAGDRTVRVSSFDATLRDVRVNSSYTSAVAGSATGTAHLSYADLAKAAAGQGAEDLSVSYSGGAPDEVKVTGTVSVMGRPMRGEVRSSLTVVNGDTVRVRAKEVPGQGLPGAEAAVRSRTDFERKITGLPKGLKLEKVVATPKGVDITLTGTDLNLAG